MTCYKPLLRYETHEKYQCKDGHWAYKATVTGLPTGYNYENAENAAKSMAMYGRYKNVQVIPCGKCIGCRLEYSKQWATKGIYEAEEHKENWFLTLTYDEKHIRMGSNTTDPKTGEIGNPLLTGTLRKKDFVDFIKRLRDHYERKYNHKGIRYMGCGEYGTTSYRPHGHYIMFNMPILESMMKFHEYNEQYEPMWRVPEIENIWGKGIVVAAKVNWNTCAYVARYITKKVGIPTQEEYYKCLGIEPEFFVMSRKPGIGRTYYEKHKDEIYRYDKMLVSKYGGGTMQVKPPKYYDKLYDLEYPEKMEKIKEQRKKDQEKISKLKYSKTTAYKKDQLKTEEDIKKSKTKQLKREQI